MVPPHSPTDLRYKTCMPLAIANELRHLKIPFFVIPTSNNIENFTLAFKAPYEGKGSEQGIIPKIGQQTEQCISA